MDSLEPPKITYLVAKVTFFLPHFNRAHLTSRIATPEMPAVKEEAAHRESMLGSRSQRLFTNSLVNAIHAQGELGPGCAEIPPSRGIDDFVSAWNNLGGAVSTRLDSRTEGKVTGDVSSLRRKKPRIWTSTRGN